jgi:hypothetical protein
MRALWLVTVFGWTALAQPLAEIPYYPETTPIRVGDELFIGGESFRISYFTTKDPVSSVAEYFFDKWKQMGLPTTLDGHPEGEMIVSAFCTRQGLQQAVVLRRRSGKTVGFATVRDLWFQAAADEGAELFSPKEGVVWLHDVESRDTAARMRHRTALIESALSAAAEAVKAQLAKRGYALVGEVALGQGGRRQLRLEHTRGERRLVTHLAEIDGGATAVVQTCLGCVGIADPSQPEQLRATARPAP